MPILKPPESDAPLSQGDLLKGLKLHATGPDWLEAGGTATNLHKGSLCLVISRPCVVAHKGRVLVAAVEAFKPSVPKDIESFKDIVGFLEDLRDGFGSPDCFYLGQLASEGDGRFCARLDSLYTVQLPPEPKLGEFLKTGRLATLAEEFARDLHVRAFCAVASMGFHDYGWYSTADLEWAVRQGKHEHQKETTELGKLEAELAKARAGGEAAKQGGLQKQIDSKRAEIEAMADALKPYQNELSGRKRT